jgi:hypothetical protein
VEKVAAKREYHRKQRYLAVKAGDIIENKGG